MKSNEANATPDASQATDPETFVPKGLLTTLAAFAKDAREWFRDMLRLKDDQIPTMENTTVTVGFPTARPLPVQTLDRDKGTEETKRPNLHTGIPAGRFELGNFNSTSVKAWLMVSPLCTDAVQVLCAMVYAWLDIVFPPEKYTDRNGITKMRQHTEAWKQAAAVLGISSKGISKDHYYDGSPAITLWAQKAVKLLPAIDADAWAAILRSRTLTPPDAGKQFLPAVCSGGHILIRLQGERILTKAANIKAAGTVFSETDPKQAPVLCGQCFLTALKTYKGEAPTKEVHDAVVAAFAFAAVIPKPVEEKTKKDTKKDTTTTTTEGQPEGQPLALPEGTTKRGGRKGRAA